MGALLRKERDISGCQSVRAVAREYGWVRTESHDAVKILGVAGPAADFLGREMGGDR
jgi:hypothetical protein